MGQKQSTNQVGAPDPELQNSPIFDSNDNNELSLDRELEEGVCYFNNRTFAIGSYVCSGDELLHCVGSGIWVRDGACGIE